MKTAVVVAYKRDSDERERNLRSFIHILEPHPDLYRIIVAESGSTAAEIPGIDHLDVGEFFSRCHNFNRGAEIVDYGTAICFADSDILVRRAQWIRSHRAIRKFDFVKPFDRWRYATPEASTQYADDRLWRKFVSRVESESRLVRKRNLCGGIVIIRREVLDRIGGWDERFVGHGCEDLAMNQLAAKGQFRCTRVKGSGYHSHHPVEYERGCPANTALYHADYHQSSYERILRRKLGTKTAAEEIDPRITIGVTAFERPDKLKQCLESIWRRYPTANVIVADNSREPSDFAELCPPAGSLKTIAMPFDCGLPRCRNAIVDAMRTEFLLLMEEDFVIDERCNIEAMLSVVESTPDIGVCGGAHENSYRGERAGFAKILEGNRYPISNISSYPHRTKTNVRFTLAEMVSNFAVMRKAFCDETRWNEEFKVGEHTEFYLRTRRDARWMVAYTPDSQIGHDKSGRNNIYRAHRQRAGKMRDVSIIPYAGDKSNLFPRVSRCVLIATYGRCGSSVFSSMLEALGIKMQYRATQIDRRANPGGYFEDLAFRKALQHPCDVQQLQLLIDLRNDSRGIWGVKAPTLVDRWDIIKKLTWPTDTRVISLTRDRTDISHSLSRCGWRDGKWMDDRIRSHSQMVEECTWPVLPLTFNELVQSTAKAIDDVCEFLSINPGFETKEAAIGLIDPSQQHFDRKLLSPVT